MNASPDELVALHGAADRWEKRAFWLLLAGLTAEIVFIWVPNPTCWSRLGDTIATIMVVAGVWAEVAFGNAGAAAQGEQLRRSNNRLADAELELARIDWRHIDKRNRVRFLNAVGALGRPASIQFWYSAADEESRNFAEEIASFFGGFAGWKVRFKECAYKRRLGANLAGVRVETGHDEKVATLAAEVLRVLKDDARIGATSGNLPIPRIDPGRNLEDLPPPVVNVYVGPKPPEEQ